MINWRRTLVTGALCIVTSAQGQALDLGVSVTARAEAGLDPATRQFIQTLPDVWRPQLKGIVDDTLARVDQSVFGYLDRVDTMISTQIVNAQCHILATGDELVNQIIRKFPWAQPGGAFGSFRAGIANDQKRRRLDSTPTFMKDLYNDQSLAASILACKAGDVSTAAYDAKSALSDISKQWLVWNRVASLSCNAALSCVPAYQQEVQKLIATSDPRDVTAANAKAELAKAQLPAPQKFLVFFESAPTFDQVETVLTQLYRTENGIGGAKALREVRGFTALAQGQSDVATATAGLDGALQAVRSRLDAPAYFPVPRVSFNSGVSITEIPNAMHLTCQQAFDASKAARDSANGALDKANNELSTAQSLTDLVANDAAGELTKLQQQRARVSDPGTFCRH